MAVATNFNLFANLDPRRTAGAWLRYFGLDPKIKVFSFEKTLEILNKEKITLPKNMEEAKKIASLFGGRSENICRQLVNCNKNEQLATILSQSTFDSNKQRLLYEYTIQQVQKNEQLAHDWIRILSLYCDNNNSGKYSEQVSNANASTVLELLCRRGMARTVVNEKTKPPSVIPEYVQDNIPKLSPIHIWNRTRRYIASLIVVREHSRQTGSPQWKLVYD